MTGFLSKRVKNGTFDDALEMCNNALLTPKICEADEISVMLRRIATEWEVQLLKSNYTSQYYQASVWYHTFWTGLKRFNETSFIDENSNFLDHYACNKELPGNTTRELDAQLKRETEWQMLFPSEMTAVLIESTVGNSTGVEIKWTNTKAGTFSDL